MWPEKSMELNPKPTVGIVGLGWLGLPLALALRQRGYEVWGTTTCPDKQAELAGRELPVRQLRLETDRVVDEPSLSEVWDRTATCILNVPPGLRKSPSGSFLRKIKTFIQYLQPYAGIRMIFVSSTSVFGRNQGEVDEQTTPKPDSPGGEELYRAEQWIRSCRPETTVLRPGGLIGPDRHPVHSLSGRVGLPGGRDPVNLVHREDCIAILIEILSRGYPGECIHAVYPEHPSRSEYYTREARKRGLPPPEFEMNPGEPARIVHSTFLLEKGFSYTHPI